MAARSAGLLLYRRDPAPAVLIAHMGGPFWAGRQEGAWSIPKGEIDPDEDERAAALREFTEELGVAPPPGDPVDLGGFRYSSGKVVRVFALHAPDFEVAHLASNTFELEWPPRSGRLREFPEVDEVRWAGLDEARPLLVAGQRPVLDAVSALLVAAR